MATPAISAERPEIRLSGKGIRWGEVLIKGLLALCALVSIATTTGIVIALLEPAIEFFREVSIVDYLTGTEWSPLFEPPQLRRHPARRRHPLGDILGVSSSRCRSASARRST